MIFLLISFILKCCLFKNSNHKIAPKEGLMHGLTHNLIFFYSRHLWSSSPRLKYLGLNALSYSLQLATTIIVNWWSTCVILFLFSDLFRPRIDAHNCSGGNVIKTYWSSQQLAPPPPPQLLSPQLRGPPAQFVSPQLAPPPPQLQAPPLPPQLVVVYLHSNYYNNHLGSSLLFGLGSEIFVFL